jgi:oxygen-independent coproporphyrinogen-3 oxidase
VARVTFPRVSFDLIYARQGQTPDAWRWELGRALAMAVDHLSLYQLTIEPGTRFGDLAARGRLRGLPAAEAAAEMFLATQEACSMAGLAGYETSNHARPAAEGRHNLVYWRYGDYAGIGPGAHGRLTVAGTRWATEAIRAPEAWLAAAEAGAGGSAARAPVAPGEQAVEMAMMGLRLAEGIDLGRYRALAGTALPEDRIEELADLGLVARQGVRLRTTPAGRPLLDAVLRRLLLV